MADIIRDPGPDAGGVSVVIVSNAAGRVEPFVFEGRNDAVRFAANLEGKGAIDLAIIYHGCEVLTPIAAQRVTFGLRAV